jgi:hypothetical protein
MFKSCVETVLKYIIEETITGETEMNGRQRGRRKQHWMNLRGCRKLIRGSTRWHRLAPWGELALEVYGPVIREAMKERKERTNE